MNAQRIIAGELFVAFGIASWNAVRSGYWPFPGSLVRISFGFAVIGIVAMAAPELAATLGAGFLLVDILNTISLNKNGKTIFIGNFGLPADISNGTPGAALGGNVSAHDPYQNYYLKLGTMQSNVNSSSTGSTSSTGGGSAQVQTAPPVSPSGGLGGTVSPGAGLGGTVNVGTKGPITGGSAWG